MTKTKKQPQQMDIKVETLALSNAIKSVKTLCSSKIHDVLNYVLLVAREDVLEVHATDLKVSAIINVIARVNKPGCVLVQHKRLLSTLQKVKDEDYIQIVDNEVVAGTLSVQQKQESIDRYPTLPIYDQVKSGFSCDLRLFCESLIKAKTCTTTEKTRYDLSVIRLENVGDSVFLIATDGKRLARVELPCSHKSFSPSSVPKEFYERVLEYYKVHKERESVTISINSRYNEICMVSERVRIQSKLSGGTFPPYEKILPKSFVGQLKFDCQKEFLKKLDRVSKFCDPKDEKVEIIIDEGRLKFVVFDEDANKSVDQVPLNCSFVSRILMQPRFLLDHLKLSSGELVLKVVENDSDNYANRGLMLCSEDYETFSLGMRFEK